jgi:rhamnose transport system ATP-binding protein
MTPDNDHPTALEIEGVHKAYGPIRALRHVSLVIRPGEIHAVCGENGAGKSTLLKILAGSVRADGGAMTLRGAEYAPSGPTDAMRAGVAIVYQERSLMPNVSVAENIAVGTNAIGDGMLVNRSRMRATARELVRRLGAAINPDRPVGQLPVALQQIVEIAKALARQPSILMLDEPTSSIGAESRADLFRLLRKLRADGLGIVYISHHLDEVFEIADRISVLRDGESRGTWTTSDLNEAALVQHMVGRAYSHEREKGGEQLLSDRRPLLEVSQISRDGEFRDISLTVHAGEIVALAGLVGAGRSEVGEAIFGMRARDHGEVRLEGRSLPPRRPDISIARGLATLSEDRGLALFEGMSIKANVAAASLRRLGSRVGLDDRAARVLAERYLADLSIRAGSVDQPLSSLSGGNRQKVLVAMWLATDPHVLIVDEPTKGVDVGAKEDIHRILLGLAANGAGILLISSDGAEVHRLADRVLVMRRGQIVAELPGGASEEHVMAYASGARAMELGV